jgi:hypothetical protein
MLGREVVKVDNKHGSPCIELEDGLRVEVIEFTLKKINL